jgi:hypothetical protein
MLMMKGRTITLGNLVYDRLRGLASTNTSPYDAQLFTSDASAESSGDYTNTANNTGYQISSGFSGFSSVNWNFRRAPGFFDVVCWTGGATLSFVNHNLGVVPELIITKYRGGIRSWGVAYGMGATTWNFISLNNVDSGANYPYDVAGFTAFGLWTQPTATQMVFRSPLGGNSGDAMVGYIFATLAGVSKVGSYTGNGSSQTINCGFTGGARFVMIKRTDSTGDWYVWDSARGIVAGNDPHLSLNSTTAEVTTDDSVDTDSTGFVVNQVAATNVNVNTATYIFLAIA